MTRGDYLGEFEHLVLLAVVRNGGEASGAAVHAELERVAQRGASLPAAYVTLARLERTGYLRGRDAPPNERGDRRGRLFALTRRGAAALRVTRETLEAMWGDDPSLVRDA